MKLFRLRLARTFATRRPERPPVRVRDPLSAVDAVQVAPNLTFYHRPPPSAPSPESFTTAPLSPLLRPSTAPPREKAPLPPALFGKVPEEKKYHLSEEQINHIRRLRASDPVNWTRSKLAKEFNTTSWFIASVSKITKERKQVLDAEVVKQRATWGERKRLSVEVQRKRRGMW